MALIGLLQKHYALLLFVLLTNKNQTYEQLDNRY